MSASQKKKNSRSGKKKNDYFLRKKTENDFIKTLKFSFSLLSLSFLLTIHINKPEEIEKPL